MHNNIRGVRLFLLIILASLRAGPNYLPALANTVEINCDQDFVRVTNGKGTGTAENPYIITGNFDAEGEPYALIVRNTTAYFAIVDATFSHAKIAGLLLENVQNGWIVRCVFEHNNTGVQVGPEVKNVTFTLNTFRANITHVADALSSQVYWDDNHVGNFWEGYAGMDPDGDGIGNNPWLVIPTRPDQAAKVDRFPLVAPVVGIEPSPDAVLLYLSYELGERREILLDFQANVKMTLLGISIPSTAQSRQIVEETVIGLHGYKVYFDIQNVVKEDQGFITVLGSPEVYESNEGKTSLRRLHWSGASETFGEETPGFREAYGTAFLPPRWVRVGDTWTFEQEMRAEELGLSEGAVRIQGITLFDRLEEKEGHKIAILIAKGEGQMHGSKYDPFVGRMTAKGQAKITRITGIDLINRKVVYETVEVEMNVGLYTQGMFLGTLEMAATAVIQEIPMCPSEGSGVVTTVDMARNLVVISLGSAHGVTPGQEFEVYHVFRLSDGSEIEESRAVLKVKEVLTENRSVCQIVEMRFSIEVNDRIRPWKPSSIETTDFSFSLPVSVVSIPQGASGMVLITIAREGGFSSPISLEVSDLPTGITAIVEPSVTLGNQATLVIHVDQRTPEGTYEVEVLAISDSVKKTDTLLVRVLPASDFEE
ncbi:MAG: NosD domain-containing protein [Candidatus Hadarchaeum sp.]